MLVTSDLPKCRLEMASESTEELLFFDTFSHDSSGEINLDLVQFPKPVIISEIRIIPLGARVQADFPGGVRLGATNPSQFKIDFFVNDLSKPEASTFARLGALEYKQNVDIQLECSQRKILTDGLVLKGLYTTITLAVYGLLNKGIPSPHHAVPERRVNDISTTGATAEWVQQHSQVIEQSYIDQSYNYAPEYPQGSQEHNYVDGWPITPVPSANPLGHNDGYTAQNKKYEPPQTWDSGNKTWDQHSQPDTNSKTEHAGSPGRSLTTDSSRDWTEKREEEKEKPRNRDERDKYWDENVETRDEREHSKARDDRTSRSDKDTEREDRMRDRRNDKERDWRRRDDADDRERDRYTREKERKEREESVKDEGGRDRCKSLKERERERERSGLRDERSSGRGRRERERSADRPSWREKSSESSEIRHRSSKSYRENSWERDRERERDRDRERERERERERDRERDRDKERDRERERERDRERNRERDRSPCSDVSNYRKRPKSPPSRSPRRPYTPTERFWSPDARGEYNSPTGRQMYPDLHEERRRSPALSPHSKSRPTEILKIDTTVQSPQTPVLSPAKYARTSNNSPSYGQSPLVQDEPSLDDEQFEPILSDEDIIDESDSQYQDLDYEFPDDMEEIIKPFNPFTFTVQSLEYFLDPSLTTCEKERIYQQGFKPESKDSELNQIYNLVKTISLEDCANIKEDWVQAVEQLLPLLDKGLASAPLDHPAVAILFKWVDIGLNLDIAIGHSQPAFKVRHIKAGVRMTDAICMCGSRFAQELVTRAQVQRKLLQLFHREYMALSIKLLILKALDSTFVDEASVRYFIKEEFSLSLGGETTENLNGYQHLFRMLEEKQLVRVKFAITSLIRKLHVYEMLENLREHIEETLKADECEYGNEVLSYLKEIEKVYANADILMSQPKRFLPVQSQFEINVSSSNTFVFLYKYFKVHKLLEIILIVLSNRKTNSCIVTIVQNLIRQFSERQDGLAFLSANPEVTNNILKTLCCQTSEEYIEVIPGTTTYLGMEIACRLQVLQHLDRIVCSEGRDEVFDFLHELYSISFTSVGKLQIAFVLSLDNNIQVLLDLLQNCDDKSAVRNYVFDLLIMTIRYADDVDFLRKFGKNLLELAESDKQSHFYDVIQWLKPLEIPNIVSYEDISPLCDILKSHTNLEGCVSLPGDLITCVRILRFLGIPKNECDLGVLPCEEEYTELKYKYVILQLYSSDCLSHLNSILTKILDYYEQPFVHSINLLGLQGSNLLSFIEPCVMLMRRMLTYVISVRNNQYKDLTHISVLIQVFTLMQAYQPNSECFPNSQKVCRDIVETLLAYTQPVADENATEAETFTKSLWTLMISDVLKYITKSSFTFIPGFLLLSELLPLPTPIPCKSELTKEQVSQIINSRKLWSAHLHTLSHVIHDLIATMAGSSYAPLLQLVRRVCLQLADLSAPTALVVSRAVLDPLLTTLQKQQQANQAPAWEIPCSSHALRLLNFLACLASHASIKAAVLSLLTVTGVKTDEKYLSLVNGFATVLRTCSNVVTHCQVQEHVILIVQALFDSDVSLVPLPYTVGSDEVSANDMFLANALPPKDLLNTLVNALLDHISLQEHSMITVLSALKALMLLTEHDYGFFHLKSCIEGKPDSLWTVLLRICNSISKENTDSLSVLCTTLHFFRELINIAEDVEVSGLPPRTMTMTPQDLSTAIRWQRPETDVEPHPITQLASILKEWSATDESFISLHENLESLVKLLSTEGDKAPEGKDACEVVLPAPMTLSAQFSSRPVYVVGDVDEKKLNSVYWLSLPTCDDSDQEMDQIGCDLVELTNSLLPDYQLSHEVERICMLKTTDDEDPKKQPASKYHFTGARTRRPFITPMRGRGLGRAPPQRGDLFRSRPPNTSRPPSLHVDDFVALETCGQQPTGPTGYNKISVRAVKDIIATRTRGRGRVYPTERGRFFGAPTYPRRESPRGLLRGRGSWLQEEAARQFHLSERLPLRTEATLGRFLGRGRALPPWSTRSEQFGGMPIRGLRNEPTRHLRTFIR